MGVRVCVRMCVRTCVCTCVHAYVRACVLCIRELARTKLADRGSNVTTTSIRVAGFPGYGRKLKSSGQIERLIDRLNLRHSLDNWSVRIIRKLYASKS